MPRAFRGGEGAHGVLVAGTTSDAGKTFVAAGLCRMLSRRGIPVQPFKAQNMSLNSVPADDGGEIAVAQWLQCLAARVSPTTLANPVLLKHSGLGGVEVIVRGRSRFRVSDWRSEMPGILPELRREVNAAMAEVIAGGALVVAEGAGSPVEMNLKPYDLANFSVAKALHLPVVLVTDLDRGGSMAQIVGTLELLEPEERTLVGGIVLNRMRGDPRLLEGAVDFLEKRTGIPVLGVVPYLEKEGFRWPEEDSLSLSAPPVGVPSSSDRASPLVGILRLPHVSNFLDFSPAIAGYPSHFLWVDNAEALSQLDAILLPGSRRTSDDLGWMAKRGIDRALRSGVDRGLRVGGVCGGYQMLGELLVDPKGFEGKKGNTVGLGLLPVTTTFSDPKLVRRMRATPRPGNPLYKGRSQVEVFEIRRGKTERRQGVRPMFALAVSHTGTPTSKGPRRKRGGESELDGAVSHGGQVWGTALHGLFHDPMILERLLAWASSGDGNTLHRRTVSPKDNRTRDRPPGNLSMDRAIDLVADHLEAHLDLGRLGRMLRIEIRPSSKKGLS